MSSKSKPMEAVVLLIDIGEPVSHEDKDGQSFLLKSKQCASRIIQRKIFSDATDQFSLIFVGSSKMDNDLNYPHIEVKQKWFVPPNWDLLKAVDDMKATDVKSADWLDGLIVAVNLLKHETEGRKFTSQKIVMLSNFATCLQSQDHVEVVIETLKDMQINLVVIGPDIDDDLSSEETKSNIQQKGEVLIGRIVDEVDGVICGFAEAMLQLDHFQKFVGKAAPWYCNLDIGEEISIPITGYKKFAPKKMLTWKKKSIENTPVIEETVFLLGDEEVDKADVIHGYLFGRTVVPISGEDKISMAIKTQKCFDVIGFTKKQNVPRHMFMGDSAHYIVPRKGIKGAQIAVTALVQALLEESMVAIVRKVYSKNSAPKIGALIPTCEDEFYFFYYVQLPYAEDERVVKLPSLSKVQLSQDQLDAVGQLIDDMDLTQLDEDEDPYSQLINPAVEHLNNMVVFKALYPDSKLPSELSVNIKKMLQPKPEILEKASTSLDKIRTLFKLKEIEQKSYRKEAADLFKSSTSNGIEVEVKPEDLADSIVGLVRSTVTEIGTVDPEGDFLKLKELGEPFGKICDQMQNVIKKLIFLSSDTVGTRKPLAALTLLREHCKKLSPLAYNRFVASIKDDLIEIGHSEFWEKIVQDKLGLITSVENEESTVSPDEADTFYQIKTCELQSEQDYELEAEDMLDML
uniref:Ku domain-containing protein n=1 Tax=Homalodisca liturata TaxID=320908 RepID=A0A1B6HY89_9HEMI